MKYLKIMFLVALFPLVMGSGTSKTTFSKGLKPGCLAPEINLQDISLKNENKYVLLQFWAAYDANSRKNNILMHNEINKLQPQNLQLVSISFDKKKSVFEETIKADKLDSTTQFNDNKGNDSENFKTYQLNKGFGNLLIDPQGIIIARDISPDKISGLL